MPAVYAQLSTEGPDRRLHRLGDSAPRLASGAAAEDIFRVHNSAGPADRPPTPRTPFLSRRSPATTRSRMRLLSNSAMLQDAYDRGIVSGVTAPVVGGEGGWGASRLLDVFLGQADKASPSNGRSGNTSGLKIPLGPPRWDVLSVPSQR